MPALDKSLALTQFDRHPCPLPTLQPWWMHLPDESCFGLSSGVQMGAFERTLQSKRRCDWVGFVAPSWCSRLYTDSGHHLDRHLKRIWHTIVFIEIRCPYYAQSRRREA